MSDRDQESWYAEVPAAGATDAAPAGQPTRTTAGRPPPRRPRPSRSRRWWSLGILVAAALLVIVTTARSHRYTGGTGAMASPVDGPGSALSAPVAHPELTPTTYPGNGALVGYWGQDPTGWVLWGYRPNGASGPAAVMRLDLDSGTEIDTPIPALASTGPLSFVADSSGALVRPLDAVLGYRVDPDGLVTDLAGALAGDGPVLPGPQPGQWWIPVDVQGGEGTAIPPIELVDATGQPVGPFLLRGEDDGAPSSDGDGGLLVTSTLGETYDVQLGPTNQPTRTLVLGRGQVLAAGPTGFAATPCEHTVTSGCPIELITRAGHAVQSDGPSTAWTLPHPTVALDRSVAGVDGGALSPDGHQLALLVTMSGANYPTLDLTSVAVDPEAGSAALVWTPNSSVLLVADRDGSIVLITPGSDVLPGMRPGLYGVSYLALSTSS